MNEKKVIVCPSGHRNLYYYKAPKMCLNPQCNHIFNIEEQKMRTKEIDKYRKDIESFMEDKPGCRFAVLQSKESTTFCYFWNDEIFFEASRDNLELYPSEIEELEKDYNEG